jgi:hypothetical protein
MESSNAVAVPTPSGLILAGDALLDPVATQTVKGTIEALLQSEQGDLFAITAGHVVDDVLAACVRVPQSNHIIELERRWPRPDEEELDTREWEVNEVGLLAIQPEDTPRRKYNRQR